LYIAKWNGRIIAKSDITIEIEGNQYFPKDSIVSEYFTDSTLKTTCPVKGLANYYNITVDKKTNVDAAWTYRNPNDEVKEIKDYIAFWRGVDIIKR
jgi:uncharacterized protein (DUF427 family)